MSFIKHVVLSISQFVTAVTGIMQNYLEISDYRCLIRVPPPISDCVCTDSVVYMSVAQVLAHVR